MRIGRDRAKPSLSPVLSEPESRHIGEVSTAAKRPRRDLRQILRQAVGIASRSRRLSVDEILASRLSPPSGVGSVSLADIENAIVEGALGRTKKPGPLALPLNLALKLPQSS